MTEEAVPSLSFDTPAGPSTAACELCAQSIERTYFTIDGQTACASCRNAVASTLSGKPGVRGWMKAIVLGSAPGLAGAVAWWAVRRYASIEVGLIAIGIGHFVGQGVRRGLGGRGGRASQILAVALTYFWITANYAPDIFMALSKAAHQGPPPTPEAQLSGVAEMAAVGVFFVVLFGIAMAAPFMGGLEGIIGILIIGFGLHQAWKLNAASQVTVEGPFRLAPAPAAPLDVAGPDR